MRGAIRHTEEVKVDVRTLDGKTMTADAATVPVGSALRIAPAFVASSEDSTPGIRVSVEGEYVPDEGRYVIREIRARALHADVRESGLRRAPTQAIIRAAVPRCIALQLAGEGPEKPWTTVADISAVEGRLIPDWIATEATKRGSNDARMDVIEVLYGASALAGLPPVKAVQTELNVPHRTAADWIKKARIAGRLSGMNYHVGRQADG
jgi:hypothetical protein